MLDALDRGEAVTADAAAHWDYVYGPDLVDGVLDLLLDGARGMADFVIAEAMSEADFARALAFVADARADAVIAGGDAAMLAPLPAATGSYAPPTETTLERFVRERRAARRAAPHSASDTGALLVAAE
jgi:dTDP-4-dehydrorhamnose reductase